MFQRYDRPTGNRMYAWRVMNPNPFGPWINHGPVRPATSFHQEGPTVRFAPGDASIPHFSANQRLAQWVRSARQEVDAVVTAGLQAWRVFSNQLGVAVRTFALPPSAGVQSVGVFALLDGSNYCTSSGVGHVFVSLHDLSLVSLERGTIPPHRPGHRVPPEHELRQAVLAAFGR